MVAPSASNSHSTSVPPDVVEARRARTNVSMLKHLRTTNTTGKATSLNGIGVYTHVEVPAIQDSLQFPHQRYAPPEMRPKFLSLGGPQHMKRKEPQRGNLPDEVLGVYNELRENLLREEEVYKKDGLEDPRDQYEGLGLPDIMVPPPPPFPPPGEEEKQTEEAVDGGDNDVDTRQRLQAIEHPPRKMLPPHLPVLPEHTLPPRLPIQPPPGSLSEENIDYIRTA
ncbi:hypothetical protein N0V90_011079 [Kalmusia sp. IMI 367209]|nr:hypothetical protein N0V90_011079 [Kalmusia sp. IMI 367209]